MKMFNRNRKLFVLMVSCIGLLVAATLLFAQNRIAPGPYGVLFRSNTATDTTTLSTTQFAPGILVGTPTAAANYTTPTAANICSAFPSVSINAPGTNTNFGYQLFIRNVSGGANTITLVAGAGVTLAAGNTNTIAQNHTRAFLVVPTACGNGNNPAGSAAVTVFSLQDSAH